MPDQTRTSGTTSLRGLPPKGRTAVVAAYQGYFVDMVDVYIPTLALAPAMAYFEPDSMPRAEASLLYYFSIVATLIGRPIGALLLGHFSDRFGRRHITILSVAGFGLMTLMIAFLPGYGTWGVWAPVVLITLRFLNGIFLGGEYTASFPLAFEYAPKRLRGLVGGVIESSYGTAFVFVSVVVFASLQLFPGGGPESAYARWGWRVSFFVAAALAIAFLVYRRNRLPESEMWNASEKARNPLRGLLERRNLRTLARIVLMMTGAWMAGSVVVLTAPDVLINEKGVSPSAVTLATFVTNIVLIGTLLFTGILSQWTGRRPVLVWWGALVATVGAAGYALLRSGMAHHHGTALVLTSLLTLVLMSGFGVTQTYISEHFRTNIRAIGFGVGYSTGLIIANFFPAYMVGLGHIVPPEQAGTVLVVISGLLILGCAAAGPETKDIAFTPTGGDRKEEARSA